MSQNDSEREVTCTLTAEQEADRSEEVQELLILHDLGYQDSEDGFKIRFEGIDELLQALAQYAADEMQCCSYAELLITVSPPYEETVLTVTGPEGTRQMFHERLVEKLEEESASVDRSV